MAAPNRYYNNYNNNNNNNNNNYWRSRNDNNNQGQKSQWKKRDNNQNNKNEDAKVNDNQNKKNMNNNNNNDNNNNVSGFKFSIVKGDLFTAPQSSSLCHCISRDLGMGKGIAVLFKKTFGGVNSLRKQQVQIGECGILLRQNRYIYYMITKERYFHKPTYNSLTQTLEYMKNHAVINGVDQISMPKIGCGLGMVYIYVIYM